MKIEITIPVFNEESSIDGKIRELSSYINETLQQLGEFKIIIADNGSTDGTKLKAEALKREMNGIEYLRLEKNGVGLALKSSWLQSNAEIIGYMDLDLATDLKYIRPALSELISLNADVVTGSRLKPGARVIGRSSVRSFTSKCFNKLLRIVFDTSFSDGMCGFKFLRRSKLESIISNGANSDGWFFATELLIISEVLRYKVYDLPVTWADDQKSKVNILKLSIEYIIKIIIFKIFIEKKRSISQYDRVKKSQ